MFACLLSAAENKFALGTEMIHLIELMALMALTELRTIDYLFPIQVGTYTNKTLKVAKEEFTKQTIFGKAAAPKHGEEKFRDKRHSKGKGDCKVNRLDRPVTEYCAYGL